MKQLKTAATVARGRSKTILSKTPNRTPLLPQPTEIGATTRRAVRVPGTRAQTLPDVSEVAAFGGRPPVRTEREAGESSTRVRDAFLLANLHTTRKGSCAGTHKLDGHCICILC